MTKVLNLDALAEKEVRELSLRGKTYKVREMSVADFIATSRLAQEISDDASFAEQMEASVKLIQRAVPEISVEDLHTLNLEQLAAVAKFVRGEDIDELAQTEGQQEGEPGKA